VPEATGTRLCRVDEIPDGAARGFTVEGAGAKVRVLAVRRGDAVYVYVNRCPHVGTPLDWAPDEFMDRERRHIVCSTHGALFRVDDGFCVAGPCSGDRLEPFPIAVRDGVVYALAEFAADFA
jgi:nitrite reductase/ring-hydroxylating ferredoxin subunit